MTESAQLIAAFDARAKRREERRGFFKAALGAAAAGAVGAAALSSTAASAQDATVTDSDILNFALNLEYLEANFYSYAVSGQGLPADMMTGSGQQGAVTGGQQVQFKDPVVARYAREIAGDERAHVAFLRSALGDAKVAQPALNISGQADGPFTAAARAAGVVGADQTFNPYSSDEYFLLGAFIFEDVGVTAYKGAAPLITNNTYLDAAAGILAAEAFHAGLVRSFLYRKGVDTAMLRTAADKISNARDSLDGSTDLDQGISPMTVSGNTVANIVPSDDQGRAFSRTIPQVHNIVYLTNKQAGSGGFFPNGTNLPKPALSQSGAN